MIDPLTIFAVNIGATLGVFLGRGIIIVQRRVLRFFLRRQMA